MQKRSKKLLLPVGYLLAAFAPDYRHLLNAAKTNPAAADWVVLRTAYAAGPTYDPFAGSTPEDAAGNAALARNDPKLAIQLAEHALQQDWLNLRAQMLAAAACRQLNETVRATLHQQTATGMIRAIMATGTGATAEAAIRVLSTSEEYVVLQTLHLRSKVQHLVLTNGHWLDVLDVQHTPDGKPGRLYFNVDVSYAREDAVAAGRAKPMADTDLP